jgi:hypothetical protein
VPSPPFQIGVVDRTLTKYFGQDRNGNCIFKLKATIPPQTSVSHAYVIDWVLTKNGVLSATTLHWDIHEEPLPDGSTTKLVETTINLDKKQKIGVRAKQ